MKGPVLYHGRMNCEKEDRGAAVFWMEIRNRAALF